jgi:hypothetical protein
VRETALYLEK